MKGERFFVLGTKIPAKWVPDPTGKYCGLVIPAVVEVVEVEVRWDTAHGKNVRVLDGTDAGKTWYIHNTTPRWLTRTIAEEIAILKNTRKEA